MFPFQRAQVLKRQASRPRRAAHPHLRPEATAGEAFQAIAIGCLDRFHANAVLLANTGDSEALHRARVALRQLRSAFSIFEPVVHDWQFEPLKEELRWLATTMNEARDLDTLIARYDSPPVQLIRARRRALAQATKALGSARARHLSRELTEWIDHGIWHDVRNPPDLFVAEFASTSLDRLRARLRKKGRHLRRQDDSTLHKLRIAAKTLRYATEFFAGQFDGPEGNRREEAFKRAARRLQDQLGALRDRAVALALLEMLRIPEDARPTLPDRGPLLERTKQKLDQLLECEPYWT